MEKDLGEIIVLEADSPNKLKIGWCIYEYNGCKVYKIVEGMESLTSEQIFYEDSYPVDKNEEYIFHKAITNKDDLKVGDKILVWNGYGTVRKYSDSEELYVEFNEGYGILEFDTDERHCWCCTCVANYKIPVNFFTQ